MAIEIRCDECNMFLDSRDEVICRGCYNSLLDEKNEMINELEEKIDNLESELIDSDIRIKQLEAQ
jgi:hypothetical protein